MSNQVEFMKEKFQVLANEVKEFVTVNSSLLEETGVYRGTQILFSPLMYKPKFLLIGINPGPGYFNNYGNNVEKFFDTEKDLEYIDGGYKLANETEALFRLADAYYPYLDEKTMKTNCCFFATNNEIELKTVLNKIMNNGRPNIYREVEAWTKRIIDMVEPEIIICEGKSVFGKMATPVLLEGTPKWEDGYGYYQSKNNIHVLGYERTFSNIKNKEKVAAKIKELVEATNK